MYVRAKTNFPRLLIKVKDAELSDIEHVLIVANGFLTKIVVIGREIHRSFHATRPLTMVCPNLLRQKRRQTYAI